MVTKRQELGKRKTLMQRRKVEILAVDYIYRTKHKKHDNEKLDKH